MTESHWERTSSRGEELIIDTFSLADYEAVARLWDEGGPGVSRRPTDGFEGVRLKLSRDPDLFLVARLGTAVVGVVIGGFDGWRAYVYHLAIAPAYRRRGIASALMDELEARLRAKGALKAKCQIMVGNDVSLAFFRQRGYEIEDFTVPAGKWLTDWRPEEPQDETQTTGSD